MALPLKSVKSNGGNKIHRQKNETVTNKHRNTGKQQKHAKTITANWTCTEIYTCVLKQPGSHWGKTVCEVVTFIV